MNRPSDTMSVREDQVMLGKTPKVQIDKDTMLFFNSTTMVCTSPRLPKTLISCSLPWNDPSCFHFLFFHFEKAVQMAVQTEIISQINLRQTTNHDQAPDTNQLYLSLLITIKFRSRNL